MVSNSANMICVCEWTLLPRHSECFLASDTRRVDVANRSQVQDVRPQRHFWLISKTALITLPEAGAGRFPVSLGQWGMFLVSSFAGSFGSNPPFPPGITGERESCERVTGKKKMKRRKREGWICPCETTLPFHTPERAPQTQLVNVKQLTMLWYKLINDTQLAWRMGGGKEGGRRKVSTW